MRALIASLCLGLAACGISESSNGGDAVTEVDPATVAGVFGMAPVVSGLVPAVVTLRPVDDGAAIDPGALGAIRSNPRIDQFGLAFSPAFLVMAAGETVVFTNSEGALAHNVHVRRLDDGESLLDEDANSGDELSIALSAPGGYDVLCEMHPGMNAFIFATDLPYAVFADRDGSFALGEIPAGDYEARVWTIDEGFGEPIRVSVAEGRLDLDLRPSR